MSEGLKPFFIEIYLPAVMEIWMSMNNESSSVPQNFLPLLCNKAVPCIFMGNIYDGPEIRGNNVWQQGHTIFGPWSAQMCAASVHQDACVMASHDLTSHTSCGVGST
jgi:hypothetical protein